MNLLVWVHNGPPKIMYYLNLLMSCWLWRSQKPPRHYKLLSKSLFGNPIAEDKTQLGYMTLKTQADLGKQVFSLLAGIHSIGWCYPRY